MTGAAPRSPRAALARDWFWATFAIAVLVNLCVEVFGMSFLEHGWFFLLRVVLSVVWTIAGAVWAWQTYQRGKGQGSAFYTGTMRNVPLDLDAMASDAGDATCHVCGVPADVVVQVVEEDSIIGSAFFLCDEDSTLVSRRDADALRRRLAVTYELPVSEATETVMAMIDGSGRTVRLM